jgi:glucose PTS system EIICB or EIICBA component
VIVGNNMQAIFGPKAENLKTDMEEYLKTAGPEADDVEPVSPVKTPRAASVVSKLRDPKAPEKAVGFISGLGGPANIKRVDACAETRLRVEVIELATIDEAELGKHGVSGIMRFDGHVHLVVGINADQYAAEMKGQLKG